MKLKVGQELDIMNDEEGIEILDDCGILRATAEDRDLAEAIVQAFNAKNDLVYACMKELDRLYRDGYLAGSIRTELLENAIAKAEGK